MVSYCKSFNKLFMMGSDENVHHPTKLRLSTALVSTCYSIFCYMNKIGVLKDLNQLSLCEKAMVR